MVGFSDDRHDAAREGALGKAGRGHDRQTVLRNGENSGPRMADPQTSVDRHTFRALPSRAPRCWADKHTHVHVASAGALAILDRPVLKLFKIAELTTPTSVSYSVQPRLTNEPICSDPSSTWLPVKASPIVTTGRRRSAGR